MLIAANFSLTYLTSALKLKLFRMIYQGDVVSHNSLGTLVLSEAKSNELRVGRAGVGSRFRMPNYRIDELTSQMDEQNHRETLRQMQAAIGGLTPSEALQLLKAGIPISDRLPTRRSCSVAPVRATLDAPQRPIWTTSKNRQTGGSLEEFLTMFHLVSYHLKCLALKLWFGLSIIIKVRNESIFTSLN